MNRPTFRDFRTQVASYAQSVGSPLGVCVGDIPALSGLVNIATERLISDPMAPEEGWWGGWARYAFNISSGNPYVALPRGIARIIVLDVCNKPIKLQNGFYEFLDYGKGLQPEPCRENVCGGPMMAYDRETTPTLGTLNSSPQNIRVYPTDSRDVGKTVIIQGTDQNGQTVLSTDPATDQPMLGETLTLALPFVTTLNQFYPITGIEKDSTFGPITIQQVNPTTGVALPLSSMEPTETSAAYRRYFVGNVPCGCCVTPSGVSQVACMAKLEYVPISGDSDYLGIPCVPALIAECTSLRYENMDNLKAAALAEKHHQKALQLLYGQLDHYLGRTRPAISVSLFGPRRMIKANPI